METSTFDMLIETYRSVFYKEVDLEFEDEDWENFKEQEEELELEKVDSWESEAMKQE